MLFIVNRTRYTNGGEGNTWIKHNNTKWPEVSSLGDFVCAGDTLELVEIVAEKKTYGGITYTREQPYTYGMERINANCTGYVTSKEKARQWLAELINKEGLILPEPRCPKCKEKPSDSDMQSLADCGKCWTCRTPKFDVIIPRPKKS
jgi:hypothetical protein